MRKLENQTNVNPPSGDFPSGQIKDDTGSSDGTPVDEALYGDIHQTNAKIARDSGILQNDLEDSNTNEFQLFEAMRRVFQAGALAQHGVFNERLATEDITFSSTSGIFISPDATIAYVAGAGVAERFTLKDGAAPVSLGSFGSVVLGINSGGIYVNTALNRIYIANPVNSLVRVFNATTGAHIAAEDIGGGALSTPVDVKIIEATAKAYILEGGTGEVTVWDISTPTVPVNIPGEDFGSGTIGTGRALYVYDDIGYVIDSDVKQWVLSTQVNTPANDIGSAQLSAPSGVFVIGRKVYAVDSSTSPPNDVFVYDGTEDREFAFLGKETFGSGDFTSSEHMFIRNNKAYICDFALGKVLVYKQNFDNEHI